MHAMIPYMNTLLLISIGCLAVGLVVLSWLFYWRKSIGQPVDPSMPYGYFFDKKNPAKVCYFAGGLDSAKPKVLLGADVASFKVINYVFARDQKRVYFKHLPIDADVRSFYVDHNNVARDLFNVYYIDQSVNDEAALRIMDGADPSTYHAIAGWDSWGKDKAHYFFKHKQLDADYESFEFLSSFWARDKLRIYHLNGEGIHPIEVDAASITLLNKNVIQEAKHIYFSGGMPGDDDPQGIQLNSFDYNPASPVEMLSEWHIRHNNKIYYCGIETDIDAESFQVFLVAGRLFHGFSKDKSFVYKFNKKITHIDVASFRVVGDTIRDKYNRYDVDGDIFGSPFQG